MLKLLGSLMLIAAGALSGYSASHRYLRRIEMLRGLLRMYGEICIRLEYSLMTFAELIESLREDPAFSVFGFLDVDTEVCDIRLRILDSLDSLSDRFDPASLENLRSFFVRLGTTDIQGQLSYAKMAQSRQKEILASSSPVLEQKAKLSRTLGLLGGAFAAIMLI